MALPTAATPGFTYFYTYGVAPNVACVHVATWWGLFRRLCIKRGLGDPVPWQATGADERSAGSHIPGAAIDWGGISRARAMLAREAGAVAWPRDWDGNEHTHAVISCSHISEYAAYQRTACIVFRRNGLGYKGMAGPDPLPAPSVWRSYQQGLDWMRAELNPPEDDDMFTDADREALQYANKQNKAIAQAIIDLRRYLAKLIADEDVQDDAAIAELKALIEAQDVEEVWGRDILRDGERIPAVQELADIKTMVIDIAKDVDDLKARP